MQGPCNSCPGSDDTSPLSQTYCSNGASGWHVYSNVANNACEAKHDFPDRCVVMVEAASQQIGGQAFKDSCVETFVVQPGTTFEDANTFENVNPPGDCGTPPIETIRLIFLCDEAARTCARAPSSHLRPSPVRAIAATPQVPVGRVLQRDCLAL